MEVSSLFSEGFDIFKKNVVIAVPFIAAGVVVSVITIALMGSVIAGMGMMGGGMFGAEEFTFSPAALGAFLGAGLLLMIISWLFNTFASGMTYTMASEARGGEADLNSALQKTLENALNLLITSVLIGVITLILLITIIGPIIAGFFMVFSLVIVMLESKGPVAAISGSINLVKSHIVETLIYAVIAIVIYVVAGIVGGILGIIPVLGWIVSSVVSGAVLAYLSIVLVLLYLEMKK
jgi:hypothetical protein